MKMRPNKTASHPCCISGLDTKTIKENIKVHMPIHSGCYIAFKIAATKNKIVASSSEMVVKSFIKSSLRH